MMTPDQVERTHIQLLGLPEHLVHLPRVLKTPGNTTAKQKDTR
ncbi:hypothetical protein [Streptomyces sp. NPDC048196]